jgi:hypothetical protein
MLAQKTIVLESNPQSLHAIELRKVREVQGPQKLRGREV